MKKTDADAHHLIDSFINPRANVYRHLALWDAWYVLAKAGRKPPIRVRFQ